MARRTSTALAGLLCLALLPAPAAAQEMPSAGSPSGAVYEIPVEGGRDEAAPRAPGGGGTTAAPAGSAAPIRSENGLGSSSVVPGAPAGAAGGEASADPPGGSAGAGDGGGAPEASIPPGSAVAAAGSAPSTARTFLLAGLAALVALGLGLASRRARA